MCEILVVKIKSLNLILTCVNRPPDSSVESFKEALDVCQKAIDDITDTDMKVRDLLQFGYYNLQCISWPNGKIYEKEITQKSRVKLQEELLVIYVENNFMENYIHTATRAKNILDLVLGTMWKIISWKTIFTVQHLTISSLTTIC